MVPPRPNLRTSVALVHAKVLFAGRQSGSPFTDAWFSEVVGPVCRLHSWIELENVASLAWPIVVIHEDMFDSDNPKRQQICQSFRDFGSRLIFVTETLTADSKQHVLQHGFQDCIEWSAEQPLPFIDCCRHAIEQAAMVRQIAAQDVLFSGIECGAMDGLWDWDIQSHRLHVSPRFQSLLGRSGECADYRPADWLRLLHPEDERSFRAALRAHLGGTQSLFQRDVRVHLSNHEYRWVRVTGAVAINELGQPQRMAGSLTDIHAQRDEWRQATFLALYDPLTGLPNRTTFMDRVTQSISRNKRTPKGFILMHLNVVRFKHVTKALGPTLTDMLIEGIAQRLKNVMHDGITLGRLEGGAFALLVDDCSDSSTPEALTHHIQQTLSSPFTIGGLEIYAHLNMGIVEGPGHHTNARALLLDAERASESGPNAVFESTLSTSPSVSEPANQLVALEADLRKAVEQESFTLFYQPIVSLHEPKSEAYEALIRWTHPTRGFVSPAQFIPLAEDTGLIVPLGAWVLRTAFEQAWAWYNESPSTPAKININVSAIQVQKGNLVATVTQLFQEYPLPSGVIRLEITETALMTDIASQIKTFDQLRMLGIEIQIDDFGTGYSSLAHLAQLPVDALKIDRSFIAKMDEDPKSEAVVRTIAHLAQSLGLQVIAEGIETEAQLDSVSALNCDSVQGYFFSKPVPPTDARKWSLHTLPSLPSAKQRNHATL